MLTEFGKVFIFFVLGIIFVAGGLLTNWLLRPSRPTREKLMIYECGEDVDRDAHIRFNIRFYVIALAFLLFDLEFVMLFPWAVVFRDIGPLAFWLGTIFLVVLIVGDLYLWKKGDLDWVLPKPHYPKLAELVTHEKPRFRPASSISADENVKPVETR
jgi:NADH-quinone oxidoreductase subunit A